MARNKFFKTKKTVKEDNVISIPPNINVLEEIKKCKNSFEYALKYITIIEGTKEVPFKDKVYKKQLELIDLIQKEHYVIINKSRQIGISTIVQAYVAWICLFYPNIKIGILSRKMSEATKFNKDIMRMIDSIPLWLTGHSNKEDRYAKQTEQTFILKNGSSVVCEAVAQSNPDNTFRGRTLHFIIIDEAAFIPKIDVAYTAILPATFKAHADMQKSNLPYGFIIISTPNGVAGTGEFFYKTWTEANEGLSKFKPFKIHYSEVPYIDEKWINDLKKSFGDLRWLQEMELLFVTPEDTLFENTVLSKLVKKVIDPLTKEIKTFQLGEDVFSFEIWKWYKDKTDLMFYNKIVLGCDIATAYSGKSNTCLTGYGVKLLKEDKVIIEQLFEVIGKFPIKALEELIVHIMNNELDITPRKKLIHENNSYGQELSENLLSRLDWDYLYFESSEKKKNKLPGFQTNSQTKKIIIEKLYWFVNNENTFIRSQRLLDDLSTIKKLTDRVPDSCIASGLVAYYISNNLDEFVNLKEYDLVKDIHEFNKSKSPNSFIKESLEPILPKEPIYNTLNEETILDTLNNAYKDNDSWYKKIFGFDFEDLQRGNFK